MPGEATNSMKHMYLSQVVARLRVIAAHIDSLCVSRVSGGTGGHLRHHTGVCDTVNESVNSYCGYIRMRCRAGCMEVLERWPGRQSVCTLTVSVHLNQRCLLKPSAGIAVQRLR